VTVAPNNEERLEAQVERETVDRLKVAVRLVAYAKRHQVTGLELVWMAEALELGTELRQLAGTSVERHRRLDELEAQLRELELAAGSSAVEA
jgi:hypothetical protein